MGEHGIGTEERLRDPRPVSWEECIAEPFILELFNKKETDKNNRESASNLKNNEQDGNNAYSGKIVEKSIYDYVIANKFSPFAEINDIVLSGVTAKQKILLGDMPEILLRQILGNTVYIQEVLI